LALLGLGLLACLWHSNRVLQVVESDFVSSRLPAPFDGFTVVQLSDLHGAQFGPDNAALLERVSAACPDLIALTGDVLDRFRDTPHHYAVDLCRRLTAIAPTYFVTGNHEWAGGGARCQALLAALEEVGVVCLENEAVALEREGEQLVVAGVHDPNGYADQKSPAETAAEVYRSYGHPFWLLLAHRNDRFEQVYARLGADLTLSGHGHGGVIRLPFTDGLLGTDRRLFPSWTSGFYEAGGAWVYVSRGLGNSGRSLRLFNRPEVAVIRLRRAA
jgi:predicted MPP superfamily phosphohydrolase